MELQDRVVIVTGAGSGIGEAIARAAHAAGARHVVVADLHGDEAARVAAEIGGAAVAIDVCDESAMIEMAATACSIRPMSLRCACMRSATSSS